MEDLGVEWSESFDALEKNAAIIDSNFNILRANKTFSETVGYPAEALSGRKCYEIVHGTHEPLSSCPFLKTLETKETCSCELEEPHLTGNGEMLLFTTSPAVDENGEVKYAIDTFEKIAAKEQPDVAVGGLQDMNTAILEKGSDGVVVVRGGEIKFVNDRMTLITGIPKEEFIGKPLGDFVSESCKDQLLNRFKRRLKGEKVPEWFETEIISANGGMVPVEINSAMIRFEGHLSIMGLIHETGAQAVENGKGESEAQPETSNFGEGPSDTYSDVEALPLEGSSPEGTALTEDAQAESDPAVEEGFPSGSFPAGDEEAKELKPDQGDTCAEAAETEKDVSADVGLEAEVNSEDEGVGAEGSAISPDAAGADLNGGDEAAVLTGSIEELPFAQFSVDRAADSIFWVREDGRLIYVNEAACSYLGFTRKELLTMRVSDIDPNLPLEGWEAHWKDVKERGSFTFESSHRAKDGRIFPVEITVNHMEYGGEGYICAFAREISQRKELEEEVRESRRRLTTLMSNLHGMAYRFRKGDGWILEFASEACRELTGHDPSDLVSSSKVDYDGIILPDDLEYVRAQVAEAIEARRPYRLSYRIITAEGSEKWVRDHGEGVFTSGGKVIAREGVITDITKQKFVGEKQLESRKFLNSIIENSGDAIITTDLKGVITLWNRGAEVLYGFQSTDVIGKNVEFLFPNKLKEEKKAWDRVVRRKETVRNIATKIMNSRGEILDISLTLSPLVDGNSSVIGAVGVSKDITDVIEAERQLREKIEELEELHRLTVKRELKMIELEKEVERLKASQA